MYAQTLTHTGDRMVYSFLLVALVSRRLAFGTGEGNADR
jgi:hypothetical protein